MKVDQKTEYTIHLDWQEMISIVAALHYFTTANLPHDCYEFTRCSFDMTPELFVARRSEINKITEQLTKEI